MPHYICVTCGVQFAESAEPPVSCPICEDERQYVGWGGQEWTTLEDLARDHHNVIKEVEPGLIGIRTEPQVGIGQRALLVQSAEGNVLWDCVSLIDEATIEAVKKLGGITRITVSHPHMFGAMVAWSHAFGNVPIHLHSSYKRWTMRPDPAIQYFDGDRLSLGEGLTLIRCGGHFTGSTVLHWADGATGRGALLTCDTIYVARDRRHVTFMRSYPNYIPLSASAVDGIVAAVEPYAYDRLYTQFDGLAILSGARDAVRRSAERYKAAIRG